MDKVNKLLLPITILLASIILGGFYYATQVNKQQSIEKQQRLELEAEALDREQEKKEYIAKRKLECYDIEQKERKNWNNVDGSFYDEENDVCKVQYVNEKWKEGDPNSCPTGYQRLFNDKGEPIERSKCTIQKYFTKEF